MVKIRLGDKEVMCEKGDNLREVLVRHDLLSEGEGASWGLCKGTLQCGTCMIRINGDVRDLAQNSGNISTMHLSGELRRSCRISVQGDLTLS